MKDQLGIRVLRTEGLGTSSSIPKKEGVWLGTESGATPLLDSAHLVPSAQTGRGPHSSYSDREVTWLALESQTKVLKVEPRALGMVGKHYHWPHDLTFLSFLLSSLYYQAWLFSLLFLSPFSSTFFSGLKPCFSLSLVHS